MHQGQKKAIVDARPKRPRLCGGADNGLLDHMGIRPGDAWRGEKDSTLVGWRRQAKHTH